MFRRRLIILCFIAGLQICVPAFARASLESSIPSLRVVQTGAGSGSNVVSVSWSNDLGDDSGYDYITYHQLSDPGVNVTYEFTGNCTGTTPSGGLPTDYTGTCGFTIVGAAYGVIVFDLVSWSSGNTLAQSNPIDVESTYVTTGYADGVSILSYATMVGEGLALAWVFCFFVWGITIPMRLMLRLLGIS